jgi:hypothetical protein
MTEVLGCRLEAGTSHIDLRWAFDHFGREMTLVANFDAPYFGPPLTGWLDDEPTWRRENPLVGHRGAGRGPPLGRGVGSVHLRRLERRQMAPARWLAA